MKVACAVHRYYPAIGGAEEMVRTVSEALVGKGYHVDVYTTTAIEQEVLEAFGQGSPGVELINGVRVFRYPVAALPIPRFLIRGADLLSIYPHGPYSRGMLRQLATGGYDVVISSPFPYTYNYFAWLFSRLRGKGLVFYPLSHFDDRYHFDRSSLYAIMRGAGAVIANTEFEADEYVRRGVRRENVFVSGCCVDPRKYVSVESRIKDEHGASRMVLFLGRKEEGKGVGTFLDAALQLSSEHPDWLFVLAGPETEGFRREYKPKAEANRRVISFGSIGEQEKLSLLSACDVLVLPSTVESFGIVYLEAWMYGKPVIGALTEVSSEVIADGKDGLLVPPGEHRALARAVEKLVARPEVGRRMGARGRRKVLARFTPGVVTGVFEEAVLHAAGRAEGE